MKIRGVKIPTVSPRQFDSKLKEFKVEFLRQLPLIEEKLSIAKGSKKERIIEYKQDIMKLKSIIDEIEALKKSKGVRAKFGYVKFITYKSKKAMIFGYKIFKKYKKENCDINNFEV